MSPELKEPPSGKSLDAAKPHSIALVVDDSPKTLSFLTDTLEQKGITALVARSGQSALSLIDRITPDIVLMDAVMPGLDGFETCRAAQTAPRIRAHPGYFHDRALRDRACSQGIRCRRGRLCDQAGGAG